MSERPRTEPRGKVVVAHPTRVVEAYSVAIGEGIKPILLRKHVPTTHVYVLDLDKLTALPEEGFFRV